MLLGRVGTDQRLVLTAVIGIRILREESSNSKVGASVEVTVERHRW